VSSIRHDPCSSGAALGQANRTLRTDSFEFFLPWRHFFKGSGAGAFVTTLLIYAAGLLVSFIKGNSVAIKAPFELSNQSD